MKKKLIIICSIVLITLIVLNLCLFYAHSSKKEIDKNLNNVDKTAIETVEKENSVDNSENIDEEIVEDNKTEEIDSSYTQTSEKENTKSESNTQSSSGISSGSSKIPTPSTNKAEINSSENAASNSNSNIESSTQESPADKDEKMWQEFITSPATLMILEADVPDWYTQSEQLAEAQKWIDLGYRVEEPYVCINLSTEKRCVYGLVVYMSKGVCNETTEEFQIDWRKKNYISIVDYAKSLGYKCEGY